jgi:hypothetical protein
MVACPSCGRELPKENLRPGSFWCPWCKEHLRACARGGRVAQLGIISLSCLLCYIGGARGASVLLDGVVLTLPMMLAYAALTAAFWPKLEKDPTMRDDFPHIVLPPDRSNKS